MNKFEIKIKEINLKKHLNSSINFENKGKLVNSVGVIYNDNSKLYPAVSKTWRDNVYSFNKNLTKHVPINNITATDLLKYYFSMYNKKLEKKIFVGRKRHITRFRRLSVNRILISKLESNFTSKNVLINIFAFNAEKYYLLKHLTLSKPKLKKWLRFFKRKFIKSSLLKQRYNLNLRLSIFKWNILKNLIKYKFRINENLQLLVKKLTKKRARSYVYSIMSKQINDIFYKYLLFINQSKFNNIFLLRLIPFLEKIYNKKVNLNLINLKYFHMNNELTSKLITMKLRKREISRYRLLIKLKKYLSKQLLSLKNKTMKINKTRNLILCNSLKNVIILKLNNNHISLKNNYFSHLLMDIYSSKKKGFLKNINYKYVVGVIMKISGRLTKRFTAARSIKQLFNRGAIKNAYSQKTGMSSKLTKGYLMPTVQYTKMNYKTRVGAYGIKGWLGSV